MSAARKPTARPRSLVLVRGGLDGSHGGGGDGDWEDFCRRIGWQTPAQEPDDDFERRIAEELLARGAAEDVAENEGSRSASGVRLRRWLLEDAEDLSVNDLERSFVNEIPRVIAELRDEEPGREVGEALPCDVGQSLSRDAGRSLPQTVGQSLPGEAVGLEGVAAFDFAPEGAVERPRRRWVRVGVAAAMLAVAAAAALAVTRLAISSGGAKAASIAAPSAESPREVAPPPWQERPVDGNRLDAPLPVETGPVRATRPQEPTVKPAPSPKAPPDVKPEPPGAVVAVRSLDDAVPDIAVTDDRAAERGAHEDGLVEWASSPSDAADAPAGEGHAVLASVDAAGRPGSGTVADPAALRAAAVRSLVPRPGMAAARERLPDVALTAMDGGAAPAESDAGNDAWTKVPAAAKPSAPDGGRPGNASWSVAGAKDRWVGASLSPSPPPLATSNIGVIVQLDLGKALGKL